MFSGRLFWRTECARHPLWVRAVGLHLSYAAPNKPLFPTVNLQWRNKMHDEAWSEPEQPVVMSVHSHVCVHVYMIY